MVGEARVANPEGIESTATTSFGKYQLFASLGRGGMADVFLSVARGQMGFNKLAVIKRLKASLAEEMAFRNMFLDEARLAARLNHPNIVHTYEVGEQNGVYFIAMEYLEGQALNKLLRESVRRGETLAPEFSVRVIADALAGLGYAHELRDYDGLPLSIIHRDISPHNLFVTYDGHTKLVDFGIAKASSSSSDTEVGVLKGKVAYMSPEQAMGQRVDPRSDLFAMGIVLWELLAQQRLMIGESAANTLHRLMNEPIPRVSSVLPTIDPVLDTLVARALEKEPSARWQSAAEMRDALESWLASRPHPVRQEDVGRTMVSFFGPVREEIQHQIQKHMASLAAAENTQEMRVLTAASLAHMAQSGANITGQLLRLGMNGSGSGSGVVPSYGAPAESNPSGLSGAYGSAYPLPQAPFQQLPQAPPAKSNSALLLTVTIGCFVLAALAIVVFGISGRKERRASDGDPTTLASVEGRTSPAGSALAAPSSGGVTDESAAGASATPSAAAKSPARVASLPAPPPRATPTKPAAPVNEDPGFVTVSSYPWAKVMEGAKVICPVTPCNKVPLAPGAHTLTFENGEKPGQKQTVSVQIKTGETTPKNIGFQ